MWYDSPTEALYVGSDNIHNQRPRGKTWIWFEYQTSMEYICLSWYDILDCVSCQDLLADNKATEHCVPGAKSESLVITITIKDNVCHRWPRICSVCSCSKLHWYGPLYNNSDCYMWQKIETVILLYNRKVVTIPKIVRFDKIGEIVGHHFWSFLFTLFSVSWQSCFHY
jgi:hypothetical protein